MKKPKQETCVLAGDVGGTKTNLGLYAQGQRRPHLRVFKSYPSRRYTHLESIIAAFIRTNDIPITSVCIGIAGPVVRGRCKTTNLPWEVSEARLKKRFKWTRVQLINDLAATALSVPLLNSRETCSLTRVRGGKAANIGILAPGTGLGQAVLVADKGRYIPVSSEGGHVDFAPGNEREVELWRYLRRRYGHVSIERVISGPGLVDIYSWLKETDRHREPKWLKDKIVEGDPAEVIANTAIAGNHPLCVDALNFFVSILGAAAGNLALMALTTGGVYLGGGIPPKILPKLKEGILIKAFLDKGRFRKILERIPVRVILNSRAALLGAARGALIDEIEKT